VKTEWEVHKISEADVNATGIEHGGSVLHCTSLLVLMNSLVANVTNVLKSCGVFSPQRDVTVTEGGCMTCCVTALGPECVVCFGVAEGPRGLYY